MHSDEIERTAPALEPLDADAAATTSGGNIFTDAIDAAEYLIERYIVEPLREMVRQVVEPTK